MKCKRCGSTRITVQETRIPGDPMGGFKIVARCDNCLSVFVPKPCTNPSPSVLFRTDITPAKTALEIVAIELDKAKERHSSFADTPVQGVCIINEKWGELAATINDDESKERQIEKAAHVAVTAIRFIEEILKK